MDKEITTKTLTRLENVEKLFSMLNSDGLSIDQSDNDSDENTLQLFDTRENIATTNSPPKVQEQQQPARRKRGRPKQDKSINGQVNCSNKYPDEKFKPVQGFKSLRRRRRTSDRTLDYYTDDNENQIWRKKQLRSTNKVMYNEDSLLKETEYRKENDFTYRDYLLFEFRRFFHGPILMPCSLVTDESGKELVDMDGVLMEYCLRRCIGAPVKGPFKNLVGFEGEAPSAKFLPAISQPQGNYEFALDFNNSQKENETKKPLGIPSTGLEKFALVMSETRRNKNRIENCKVALAKLKEDYLPMTQVGSKKKKKKICIDSSTEEDEPIPFVIPTYEEAMNSNKELAPGELAMIIENDYQSKMSADLQTLYRLKDYLNAGIYSHFCKEESKDGKRFKLPLPMYYIGRSLIETEQEFKLPFDVVLYGEQMKRIYNDKKPPPYQKIRSNIFVERKPRKPKEVPVCQCSPSDSQESSCSDLRRVCTSNGALPPMDQIRDGCLGDCLNRCMLMECNPDHCSFKDRCANQRFQRKEEIKELEVFHTEFRGFGLRTLVNIEANALVQEYRGEIISQATCLERMRTIYKDLKNYYILDYSGGEVVDGCVKGTDARYVNHSCEPNCRIEKWQVDGEYCIGLFANHFIPAGTELTYDYRFQAFGPMQKCLCGSRKCRGFIGINKKVCEPNKQKQNTCIHREPSDKDDFSTLRRRITSNDWHQVLQNKDQIQRDHLFLVRNVRQVALQQGVDILPEFEYDRYWFVGRKMSAADLNQLLYFKEKIQKSQLFLMRNFKSVVQQPVKKVGSKDASI